MDSRTNILTPTRKSIIAGFKEIAQLHESEFGKPLTREWREKLLIHFRETYKDLAVEAHDINRWIKDHKWISEPAPFCSVSVPINAPTSPTMVRGQPSNLPPLSVCSVVGSSGRSGSDDSPASSSSVRFPGSNNPPASSSSVRVLGSNNPPALAFRDGRWSNSTLARRGRASISHAALAARGTPVPGWNNNANVTLNNTRQQPDPHSREADTDNEFIEADEEPVIVTNHEERTVQEQLATTVFGLVLHHSGPGAVFESLEPVIRRVYSTTGSDFETMDFERLLGSGPLTHERFMEIYDKFLRLIHDLQNMAGDGDDDPATGGLITNFMTFIQNTHLHHAAFLTGDEHLLEGFPNPNANNLPDEADMNFEPNF